MSDNNGTWYGVYAPTGDQETAEEFAREDGAKAQTVCAAKLTKRLGYEVKPGYVRVFWGPRVEKHETSVGALKGLVGKELRP
jgi:hypothetical protein